MNLNKLIQTHLLKRSVLSYALYPLGLLYADLQKHRRNYYHSKAYKAPCKVISIGNIVSGGSGKTPLTIALAKLLQEKGLRIGVSHRGYKGAFEHSPTLISDPIKVLFTAQQTGDEAYLIASALPSIPVVVGRKRKEAIRLLLRSYPATEVVILDDALQHVKVFRDLDIVSFAEETGLGNGFVLPSGYLREGLSAINDRSIAIIYRKQMQHLEAKWMYKLSETGCRVFGAYSHPIHCVDAKNNMYPLESLKGKRLVLVSGIAHPASFERTVKDLGLVFSRHFAFPDHCDYQDVRHIQRLTSEMPELILCTQKDLMKLARHASIATRLRALVLDYSFDEPAEFLAEVISSLNL